MLAIEVVCVPAIVDRVVFADRQALQLCARRNRMTCTLAHVAASILERQIWVTHGDSRLADFARERLGRSGRWLLDLSSLHHALETHPSLAAALCGEDGAAPIGRVSARWIGLVADRDSLASWIRLARRVSARELRSAVRAVAHANSATAALIDPEETWVRIALPAAVRVAFDETFDLHRRISGCDTSLAAFVEALVAESGCGPSVPDGPDPDPTSQPIEAAACRCVQEIAPDLVAAMPINDHTDLVAVMRQQIEIEDSLERELGLHLESMDTANTWRQLGYRSLSHYGEGRLGLARTTVQNRVALARSRRHFPRLYAVYSSGQLGFEAALLVLRILRSGDCREPIAMAWIRRGQEVTVKRLRDELRLVERSRLASAADAGGKQVPFPPTDAQWHASIGREPGQSLLEVWRLGTMACDRVADALQCGGAMPKRCTDVFLNLRLPEDLAADFWSALQVRSPRVDGRPSAAISTQWLQRGLSVPVWVNLLHMLEEFVMTWDNPRAAPRRAGDAVYSRDGWRCSAPGCTARANLEDHHLVYRSAGGTNALSNRISVCSFHHRMGEHGGLASCRGVAPLGVRWRLGTPGSETRFFNERRVVLDRSDARRRPEPATSVMLRGGCATGEVC